MVDLSVLTPTDRAAVLLAMREGETYRTVAALLGEPEEVTLARIRQALTALRAARPTVAVTSGV